MTLFNLLTSPNQNVALVRPRSHPVLDGKVELKPDPDFPASRDFGLIFSLLSKVFDLAREILIYRYAENYNVEVLYKPASGEVTKFIFTLKEGVKK